MDTKEIVSQYIMEQAVDQMIKAANYFGEFKAIQQKMETLEQENQYLREQLEFYQRQIHTEDVVDEVTEDTANVENLEDCG